MSSAWIQGIQRSARTRSCQVTQCARPPLDKTGEVSSD